MPPESTQTTKPAGQRRTTAAARSTRRHIVVPDATVDSCAGAQHALDDIVVGAEPIPLTELPSYPAIPKKRGERVHFSAMFQWASRGLRGHRLETAVPSAGSTRG
jgi:hypothetical protein